MSIGPLGVPVRYSELDRRRASFPRAAGPCAIARCSYWGTVTRNGTRTLPYPLFFYDHCHEHDYVRGVLCRDCNGLMAAIDARVYFDPEHDRLAARLADRLPALFTYWRRCPECGPWEPWLTREERRQLGLLHGWQRLVGIRPAAPLPRRSCAASSGDA